MKKRRRAHVLSAQLFAVLLAVGLSTGCTKREAAIENTSAAEKTPEAVHGKNEDPSSNLGAWGRAMGSVLISMNEGSPYYFGGYAISDANEKAAKNILKQSWNIDGRKELLRQIRWLVTKGSRADYRREAKEMNSLSDKQLKKAMRQLEGSLLIHYERVQDNWKTWKKKGLLAWDLCRVSHLAQWGYIAGFVTVEEAQALLEPAAVKLQNNFQSWEEVITNWLDGYALSETVDKEESGNDYEKRMAIYLSLVEGQKENGVLYEDSLFSSEITPLQKESYDSLMEEIEDVPRKTGKGQ